MFKLRNYQEKAATMLGADIDPKKRTLDTPTRMIVADEMGLGKTATAIVSAVRRDKKRILVIALNSLKYNWESEIKNWYPEASVVVISSKDSLEKQIKDLESNCQFTIVSYNQIITMTRYKKELQIDGTIKKIEDKTLDRLVPTLKKIDWDCFILDEAHYLRNRKSKAFKSMKGFLKKYFGDIFFLTGTPLHTNPEDLWALCNLLFPVEYGNFWNWVNSKCKFIPIRRKNGQLLLDSYGNPIKKNMGFINPEEIRKEVSKFFIRRLRKDTLELPKLTINTLEVSLTDRELRAYRTLEKKEILNVEGTICEVSGPLAKYTALKQGCISFDLLNKETRNLRGSKIEALEDLVESCDGEKVIIFSQYAEPLDRILEKWNNKGKTGIYLYRGGMDLDLREKNLQAFKNKADAKVLLASLGAGSTGLNITEATVVIFLSFSESPAINAQAISRAYRSGQENPVIVYAMVTKDTVEEKMMEVVKNRELMFDAATPKIDIREVL